MKCPSFAPHIVSLLGLCAVLTLTQSGCQRAKALFSDSETERQTDTPQIEEEEPPFIASNDIGMTVRSVASTINIGEPLDSSDYSFSGVLTDGIGMPLFTDASGMPGRWQIEVIDSTRVSIRNLSAGYLQPHELMEYLALSLGEQDQPLEHIGEQDRGDTHIDHYRLGRTNLSVETTPEPIGDTGEVSPRMEIILHRDSLPRP